jgi:hypothetical protein
MTEQNVVAPALMLRQLAFVMRASRALYAAAELNLADFLVSGPMTSGELAAAAGADPATLRRLMRVLVARDVFEEETPDRFRFNAELQLAIGVLLLLFGMRWLRKAIFCSAGVFPLHDEATAFAAETADLRGQASRHVAGLDWLAALTSFKAVLLEGLEVVFTAIAASAGGGLLASGGALAACLLVAGAGLCGPSPAGAGSREHA